MVEGMSDSGGFADWMAGSVGRGGLNQNFGNYSQGYRGAVAIQQESDTQQALRLAMGYRNDVSKRTGALLMANGFNRGDAVTLARAIGPLIPQGTPAEKEAQRVAAMSDQGSAAMENQFTYRSDLARRSEEHTSELQSLMRISYAVFCLKKKKNEQHKSSQHTP